MVHLQLALGFVLFVAGGEALVRGAVSVAGRPGVSPLPIGLTLVGFDTSLPELVTSVIAALRRESAIAFGNVVGSNLYSILGILGVTALVRPIDVPPQIAQLDVWVMAGATLAPIAVVVAWQRIGRGTGAAFLATYAGYTTWLVTAA